MPARILPAGVGEEAVTKEPMIDWAKEQADLAADYAAGRTGPAWDRRALRLIEALAKALREMRRGENKASEATG